MKKELAIGITGLILLLLAFVLDDKQQSFTLLIVAIAGLLLSIKYKMVGSILLCFSSLALVIDALMFSSSYWLLPCALLISYTGFYGLIKWWQHDK